MSNEKIKEQKVTAEQVAEAIGAAKPPETKETEPEEPVVPSAPLAVETTYTREEIEASPSSFGVRPEVLAGSLRLVDGDALSRSQVLAAIENFKKRKV